MSELILYRIPKVLHSPNDVYPGILKAIRLYDPFRHPQHWGGLISPGQFAVSHFDYKTGTWRTADGHYADSPDEELFLLFNSFPKAERYCRCLVEQQPSLYCRIYDHRGTAEGVIAQVFAKKVTEREFGPRAAWRKIRNGAAQLSFGVFCVAFDWGLGGPVILGVVVGSKFVTTGIVRLVQGYAGLLDRP